MENPWSVYWANANLHSCLAADEKSQLAIEQLWFDMALQLPAKAKVLDLATGNGAVPHALLSHNPSLLIDAVDKADIKPELSNEFSQTLSKVRFFPNQDIVALDATLFSAHHYDALVSQFGAEYAGLHDVLDGCLPLLKLGGKVKLIVHHECSNLLSSSRMKLEELAWLLTEKGLVDTLVDWSKGLTSFAVLEKKGRDNMEHCAVRSEQISGQVFAAVRLISELKNEAHEDKIVVAETMRSKMRAEQQRLQQLSSAAQSADDIEALKLVFKKHHCAVPKVERIEFSARDYLLGWSIESHRTY